MDKTTKASAEIEKLVKGVHLARYYVRQGESWQDKELVENAEVLLTKLIEEHTSMKAALKSARETFPSGMPWTQTQTEIANVLSSLTL